ncbi:MAG: transcriptional repressor LexA [Oscillospiraceae bacterium]|nr:transcriptional repressor LexA [Oscillospiraceae bacterium]
MKELTPQQKKIYDYIVSFSQEHGYPPSIREIGAHVGLKSPSTVHFHLKSLQDAGWITQEHGKTRTLKPAEAPAEQKNQVPVVGNVAAGSPILAEQSIEDYLLFDTQGLAGEHFALRVRGESMLYAGILPDDLVIVHQQQDARNGDIVVALLEDEATVKTLRRENGRVLLMPENPAYEPIDGEGAQILGRVVAVVRRY